MPLSQINQNSIVSNSLTASDIANNSIGSTQLANTGVTAGTYGSPTAIPVVTVGSDGRITSTSTVVTANPYLANSNNTIMVLSANTSIVSNTTVSSNTGVASVGPITVVAGVNVTLSANSRWVIL